MKTVKQLLEVADKRTQGEWNRDVSKAICSTYKGVKKQIIGQTWYKEKEKYNDFFSPEDLNYVINAPLMEAKLREMVEMLPNIKTGLSIMAHNPDMMECERNGARKAITRIEQWEG